MKPFEVREGLKWVVFFIMTTQEGTDYKYFCFHKETKLENPEEMLRGENIGHLCHLIYIDRKSKQPISVVDAMLKENQVCCLINFVI